MEASAAAGAGGGEPEPEASAPEPEVSGRRSSVIDMSQWMSADGQLQGLLTTKPDPLEVLVGISRSLSTGLSFQDLIDSILHSAKQLIECDRATLWLCDHDKEELYSFIADGGKTFRLPMSKGIAGESATKNEAINIEDAYQDPRETDPSDVRLLLSESLRVANRFLPHAGFNPAFDKQSGYKTTTILCVPIVGSSGNVLGVCQMINKGGGGEPGDYVEPGVLFSKADQHMLGAFMAQAALSIENEELAKEKALLEEKVQALQAELTALKAAQPAEEGEPPA